ncbi:NUDIX hydrolase, partial [Streptomyces hydrogenans]
AVDPMPGISTSHHRVYWADRAEYMGHPEDDFESTRREWVPLARVPELIARGEIPAANMAAGLLMLHHLRLG